MVHTLVINSSQSFNWISSVFCMHIKDLVNMCMVFNLAIFSRTVLSKKRLIVHSLCNHLLSELTLDLFNILHTCYMHIEDVHADD